MKRFLILLSLLFCNTVCADTINLHWLNDDGTTYQNSTCVIDSDLILPATPPTRYGYTFTGWKMLSYQPIEYLESTGTQYIDTGVQYNYNAANSQFSMTITYAFPVTVTEKYGSTKLDLCILGNTENILCLRPYSWNGGNGTWVQLGTATGTDGHLCYGPLVKNQKEVLNLVIDSNNNYTIEWKDFRNFSGKITSSSYSDGSLYMFAARNVSSEKFPVKIYNASFESNGVKIRDFIPVLDKDGVPCMFDKVEGKFYYNQGAGQFIAGPVLTE